ncbi:MAG: hypothetical protein FWH42_01415 [Dehalococcoidia bacterium]|nr:hypothetical protein [Dehalococcoidia bacterium]
MRIGICKGQTVIVHDWAIINGQLKHLIEYVDGGIETVSCDELRMCGSKRLLDEVLDDIGGDCEEI